jgi:hypothetical protein
LARSVQHANVRPHDHPLVHVRYDTPSQRAHHVCGVPISFYDLFSHPKAGPGDCEGCGCTISGVLQPKTRIGTRLGPAGSDDSILRESRRGASHAGGGMQAVRSALVRHSIAIELTDGAPDLDAFCTTACLTLFETVSPMGSMALPAHIKAARRMLCLTSPVWWFLHHSPFFSMWGSTAARGRISSLPSKRDIVASNDSLAVHGQPLV